MARKLELIKAMFAVVVLGCSLLITSPLLAQTTVTLRQATCDQATAAATNQEVLSYYSQTGNQLVLPAGSYTVVPFAVTAQNLTLEGTVDQANSFLTILSFPTGSPTGLTLQNSPGATLKNLMFEGPAASDLVVLQGPGTTLVTNNFQTATGNGQTYDNCLIDDNDNDGLSNRLEAAHCTDPNNPDSDNDGLADGVEDLNHNSIMDGGETNPCLADTDGDGLNDGAEIAAVTNPLLPDTDGDGLSDRLEITTGTNPIDTDTDDDGVNDNLDNCPLIANSDQADLNGDGTADACQFVKVVFELPLAAGADAAAELLDTGVVTTGIAPIKMGTGTTVGLRFLNPALPPGSFVTKAYLQFVAMKNSTVATQLTISGEAVANAQPFNSANNYSITSRVKTQSSVPWSPASWLTDEYGAAQQTSDIAPLIQEIIENSDWAKNNAMVLIISGTGTRNARTYLGAGSGKGPVLHLECLVALDGPTSPSAKDDNIEILPNSQSQIAVLNDNGNGPDTATGGSLNPASLTLIRGPVNGSVTAINSNGTISYKPNAGFGGIDQFSYTVRDNNGQISNTAMVTIMVTIPVDELTLLRTGCCDVAPTGSYFEAEEYSVAGDNWTISSDSQASGGNFLLSKSSFGFNPPSSPVGAATEYYLNFTEAGTYYLSFRVFGSYNDSSLFYGINNWYGDTAEATNAYWQWSRQPLEGSQALSFYISRPGTYCVKIWARKYIKLDGFFLTKNNGLVAEPAIPNGAAIAPATEVTNDGIYLEAENYTTHGSWDVQADASASGGSVLAARSGWFINNPSSYDLNFPQAGTYYLWLRAKNLANDEFACGLDGNTISMANIFSNLTPPWIWNWTNRISLSVNNAGVHAISLKSKGIGKLDGLFVSANSNAPPPIVPSGSAHCSSALCN